MIDRMDAGIGEILQKVKSLGEEENTLVLFLSDNGGSADDVKNWNYVTQKMEHLVRLHRLTVTKVRGEM